MNILAFDTATDKLSIALKANGNVLKFSSVLPRVHLKFLIPEIDRLIKKSLIKKEELNYVAVGTGPGSFTGLRIGIATARALAQGLNKPLLGVCSFAAIAKRLIEAPAYTTFQQFCLTVDAKKGELYTALFTRTAPFKEANLELLKPAALITKLKQIAEPVLLAGDGIVNYESLFRQALEKQVAFADADFWYPDAAVLINVAEEKMKTDKIKPYYQVLPIYMRAAH